MPIFKCISIVRQLYLQLASGTTKAAENNLDSMARFYRKSGITRNEHIFNTTLDQVWALSRCSEWPKPIDTIAQLIYWKVWMFTDMIYMWSIWSWYVRFLFMILNIIIDFNTVWSFCYNCAGLCHQFIPAFQFMHAPLPDVWSPAGPSRADVSLLFIENPKCDEYTWIWLQPVSCHLAFSKLHLRTICPSS